MPIVQISAALGPTECELAVKYTLQELEKDAKNHQIILNMIESNTTQYGYSSVLYNVPDHAQVWRNTWLGSIQ